jgi:hypothetical protein
MFSLSLLCKKNASHIQNYPFKYSQNWKPFRHKEMEFLPFSGSNNKRLILHSEFVALIYPKKL